MHVVLVTAIVLMLALVGAGIIVAALRAGSSDSARALGGEFSIKPQRDSNPQPDMATLPCLIPKTGAAAVRGTRGAKVEGEAGGRLMACASRLRSPGLVVALIVLLCSQGIPSYAASSTITIPMGPSGVGVPFDLTAPLNRDWSVGDCVMSSGSFLGLTRSRLTLKAMTATRFTRHADVWHSDFNFLDRNGTRLYSYVQSDVFDSPNMIPANGASSGPSRIYSWTRVVDLPAAPPTLESEVSQVTWSSSC
jgi:hypothetical protein